MLMRFAQKLDQICRRLGRAATCHHALYGYLALLYGAGCAGVLDKDVVAQGAAVVYAALSVRG